MVSVGILGFGRIALEHAEAYFINNAAGVPVKLLAVCDINQERFKALSNIEKNFSSKNGICTYLTVDEMLLKEDLDLIDICLPTFLHYEAIMSLLKKGYHVFCEKPMTIKYFDCINIMNVAKSMMNKLMISQCLRFFPPYEYLKTLVAEDTYGKVISAFFQRLSGFPSWGWNNWFRDVEKSGSNIFDQHIHDVDMIRYLFGEPVSVNSYANGAQTKYDSVITNFNYSDNKLVTAISDWGLREGVPFQYEYRVNFEKATVIYKEGVITLYKKMRPPIVIEIEGISGITNEIKYFINIINNKAANIINPPESAAETIALVELIKRSADKNGATVINKLQ